MVKWVVLAIMIVIAGIFIIPDCKNSEAGWDCRFKIPFFIDKVYDVIYKEKCNNEGGDWKCYGMCGFLYTRFCDFPLDDAGKECTNSEQCKGRCIIEETEIKKQYPNLENYAYYEINCTDPCPTGRCSKDMLRLCDYTLPELNDGIITKQMIAMCD